MAMLCSTEAYEAFLRHFSSNVNRQVICTTQPTTYEHATSNGSTKYWRGATSALTSGEWTIAASTVSGYKISSTQVSGITISTSGSAQHIAHVNTSSSKLIYVTTCTAKNLTTADTVTIPSWSIHLLQPSSST